MPRSSSSGRSSPRTMVCSNYKSTTVAPAPVPTAVRHTVEAPSFGQSMKQGFGFGMGSAIAHNIFGSSYVNNQTMSTAPIIKNPEYEKCMKESFNDKEVCKQYLSEER